MAHYGEPIAGHPAYPRHQRRGVHERRVETRSSADGLRIGLGRGIEDVISAAAGAFASQSAPPAQP
jgi:hypothetical protein